MATPSSLTDRRSLRRQATVDEALDHAVAVMTEAGVGALTISEVARRTGMRGPSLYKYFPSLHALYDALFARGLRESSAAAHQALDERPPGVERVRAGCRAMVRWAVENPALAQLLFWRPVPGFAPSPEVFQASRSDMEVLRGELRTAVRLGELSPAADSDDAVRILTVAMSGLLSQQMANQPTAPFEHGDFTRLTDEVLELFLDHYAAH